MSHRLDCDYCEKDQLFHGPRCCRAARDVLDLRNQIAEFEKQAGVDRRKLVKFYGIIADLRCQLAAANAKMEGMRTDFNREALRSKARIARLEKDIRELEWCGETDGDEPNSYCAFCFAYEGEHHTAGCKYAEIAHAPTDKQVDSHNDLEPNAPAAFRSTGGAE